MEKHKNFAIESANERTDEEWKLKTKPTPRNQELSVYFKPGTDDLTSFVCGELLTTVPIEKIDGFISDREQWGKFDKQIDKTRLIKQLTPDCTLEYRSNKGNFMMKAQDYTMSHC